MSFIENAEPIKYRFLAKEPVSTNDISFVYEAPDGESRLIEKGNFLTNTQFRKKNYTMRYQVSRKQKSVPESIQMIPSKKRIEEFRVSIGYTVKVIDPIAFVKSDWADDPETNINHLIKAELRPMAHQYTIDECNEYEADIIRSLNNRSEFEQAGLKVDVQVNVDLSDELKDTLKRRNTELSEIDHEKEKQEKEFGEFRKLLAGTPAEMILMMYGSVEELRKHLQTEYNDRKKVISSLKEKFMDGKIDEYTYKKSVQMFNGSDSLLGSAVAPQIEETKSTGYIEEKEEQAGGQEKQNVFGEAADRAEKAGVTDKGWEE